MRPIGFQRMFLGAGVAAAALLLNPAFAPAQETLRPAPDALAPGPDAAVLGLADSVRDLQEQLQALQAQMTELRAEQQRSGAEAAELRRQLNLAATQLALRDGFASAPASSSASARLSLGAPGAAPSSVPPQESASELTAAQRVSKLEESVQLTDAKVSDQYQTKIESGSKYRMRLSGIVLVNMFSSRGTVDNIDFPAFAEAMYSAGSTGSFGGSLRQSQIGLEVFGPDVAGARTSANVRFDFAGGFPDVANGSTMGIVRLRTGTVRLDWAHTSIIAGQDSLFLAPLAPKSLATIAVPALSYAGNLWSWAPQVRIEHRVTLSEGSSLQLQGAVLDSLSGDFLPSGFERYESWGEQSGLPAVATRIAYSHRAFGQTATLGVGGYFGRQDWGLNRKVDGWAITTDLLLPLGRWFELSGQFYRGLAVGGLGGSFGQSVLMTGDLSNPSTVVVGLDSVGGWAQLKFKATPKLELNAAAGQDNPFAHELRRYGATTYSDYGVLFSKNLSPMANFIYQFRSNVLFSTEYRYLRTYPLDVAADSAHQISLSLGYIF